LDAEADAEAEVEDDDPLMPELAVLVAELVGAVAALLASAAPVPRGAPAPLAIYVCAAVGIFGSTVVAIKLLFMDGQTAAVPLGL